MRLRSPRLLSRPVARPTVCRIAQPKTSTTRTFAEPTPAKVHASAIVTRRAKPGRFGDVPDMTTEKHQRRGDAADALFRELVRRATGEA
jgi:hypothetical protein